MPADCDCKKEMAHVDLSLAINYLPAVACIVKTVIIATAMALAKAEHAFGAFTIIALTLNIDKVVSSERIFNGNAVLFMVLLSWFLNHLRQGMEAWTALGAALSVWWVLFGLCLLLEPNHFRPYLSLDPAPRFGWGVSVPVAPRGERSVATRYIPVVVNTVCIGVSAFTRLDGESGWFRITRSVAFASLCVTWVYVVGVWQRCGTAHQPLMTQNMLARFCQVLYLYPAAACVYAALSAVGLVCLYLDIHAGGLHCFLLSRHGCEAGEGRADAGGQGLHSHSASLQHAQGLAAADDVILETIDEEEPDVDLEACFRTACQERRMGGGLNAGY